MRGPAVRPDDALLTTARARIAASATTAVARVGRTRDVLFTSCLLLVSGCRVFRGRASATCPRRVADLRMRGSGDHGREAGCAWARLSLRRESRNVQAD